VSNIYKYYIVYRRLVDQRDQTQRLLRGNSH
jgi:hypothetical protein